ncbi:MAG: hypothetical protein JO372_01205 [Solirubrobacterales bacterium]|nr:hypothetical protein [Solirubrobacterales bacterium]
MNSDTHRVTPSEERLLTDLPYGLRQRIVVLPDDLLSDEQQVAPQQDEKGAWRPWDLLKGDPTHPSLKALKEAEEEGLGVLPVPQSAVGILAMPIGHPLPKMVYIGSPAVPARYYPVADFHRRVFEEKFSEAALLLMGLGAERFSVWSIQGWSRDIAGDLETPLQKVVKTGGEVKSKQKKDNRLLFEAELTPRGVTLPKALVWYQHEPSWRTIAEGRLKYGLRNCSLIVSSTEDYGIDTELAAKLRRRKILSLGGEFTKHVDTIWVMEGTFAPAARRARWRS